MCAPAPEHLISPTLVSQLGDLHSCAEDNLYQHDVFSRNKRSSIPFSARRSSKEFAIRACVTWASASISTRARRVPLCVCVTECVLVRQGEGKTTERVCACEIRKPRVVTLSRNHSEQQ